MSDLISRQAAIGRAVELPLFGKMVKVVAVSELEALPSAQPEINCSEFPNSSDLISRQAVIDALDMIGSVDTDADREYAMEVFMSLPSVQPLVLTCDGCRHVGTYDTDFPCSGCIRREKDYYEQER